MHRQFVGIAHLAISLATLIVVQPALAVGYWSVPGNVAQWWGYGWGAGHHACLVLGPISQKGAFAHNQVRLPHSPQPMYGYCEGCAGHYDFGHPSVFVPPEYRPSPQLLPSPSQTLTPDELPMPDAAPAFPAPVER